MICSFDFLDGLIGVDPPLFHDFLKMIMVFSQELVSRYRELEDHEIDCILLMQVGAVMQVMEKDARVVPYICPNLSSSFSARIFVILILFILSKDFTSISREDQNEDTQ